MGNASKAGSSAAGGLSGWGEAESEPAAIAEAAGEQPAGGAGPKGRGTTETDAGRAMAELAPPGQQGRDAAGGRDAVAGMGEVDMGQGRNAEGLRTGDRQQLRPKSGKH